jgi:hypothetical protein
MESENERLEQLRKLMLQSQLGFCIAYSIQSPFTLQHFHAVSSCSMNREEYERLGRSYRDQATQNYLHDVTTVIEPDLVEPPNPPNANGVRWWVFVVGSGETREAGYVVVAKIGAIERAAVDDYIRKVQRLMRADYSHKILSPQEKAVTTAAPGIEYPINEKAKLVSASLGYFGYGLAILVVTLLTVRLMRRATIIAPPPGQWDELEVYLVTGCLALVWLGFIVGILAIALRRRRDMKKLTGAIIVNDSTLRFGAFAIPRTAIVGIEKRGWRLRTKYTNHGKLQVVSIPLSWFSAQAIDRLRSTKW